ncbi:hypothetical protein [Halobellus captivus]|uniref:hypothetical protein n=1 Tax=Halobellus captivus TaxID=2592614 RepID=UPI0011A1614B|nr:hypothetical protein [Halobellus captivus]
MSTDESRPAHSDSRGASDEIVSHRRLQYLGVALALAVAALHLAHPDHGVLALFALLYENPAALQFDPRPAAFVASGMALFVGVSLSRNAPDRKPYYVAGIALGVIYIVGYFAWHFTGHGGFLPGREPLLHDVTPLENVISHLSTDPWAAASKAGEICLVAVLGVLLRRE